MTANNSGSMLGMLSTQYELICFIVSIKLLFCNVFIESFDYRSTVFGINKYSWFLQNNLAIGIKATLIDIEAIKFVYR